MKIHCSNYECKYRNDNTRLCTKIHIHMVTDSWNRHGVICNSVETGEKLKKSYYTPSWLKHLKEQAILDKRAKRNGIY